MWGGFSEEEFLRLYSEGMVIQDVGNAEILRQDQSTYVR